MMCLVHNQEWGPPAYLGEEVFPECFFNRFESSSYDAEAFGNPLLASPGT